MDFGDLLSRSWRITWQNKYLWLLGFLSALGSANGGNGGSNTSFQSGDQMEFDQLLGAGAALIGVICIGLIIGLILWLVSLIARAGLINAAVRHDAGETVTLGQAFAAGREKLGRLVGLSLLLYGGFIILIMVLAAVLISTGVATQFFESGGANVDALLPGVGIAVVCILALFCLLLPLIVLVSFIYPFAFRGVVLQDLGVTESVRHGWEVLRENLGDILLLALLFLVINFVIGVATAIVVLPLSFIVFLPMAISGFDGSAIQPLQIVFLAIAGIGIGLLAALVRSVPTAWQSVTFTLAYQRFLAKKV